MSYKLGKSKGTCSICGKKFLLRHKGQHNAKIQLCLDHADKYYSVYIKTENGIAKNRATSLKYVRSEHGKDMVKSYRDRKKKDKK